LTPVFRKYPSIVTLEQREVYQTDFCSEYSEYIDLHSRIATITHMFVQLASKIKSLSPGTQQYKVRQRQAQTPLLIVITHTYYLSQF
jgi:hypothetical protein